MTLPGAAMPHRAFLYDDDLVVFVAPNAADLHCLKDILALFAGASGLITNMDKCLASPPIRCSEDDLMIVQQAFPCRIAPFPCRYLGAPLSFSRLRRPDEEPLVDAAAARIPTWKAGLLTCAGRVVLTKVTLSAIPVHISIAACLSDWDIQQIDRRRRAFLWAGTEVTSGGSARSPGPRSSVDRRAMVASAFLTFVSSASPCAYDGSG